jgi:hypothetical protein
MRTDPRTTNGPTTKKGHESVIPPHQTNVRPTALRTDARTTHGTEIGLET